MQRRRLALENLECRRVLTSVGWDGPGLGAAELSYFVGDAPNSLTQSDFESAIETALDAWSAVVDIEFTQTNISRQADSLDFSAQSLDGGGGTLAQAYFPDDVNRSSIAGDVQFDSSETWEVGDSQGRSAFDLVIVAVHEIGHALGLEHIHQSGSILQPTISPNQTFAGLSIHDIEAIQRLYAAVDVTPIDDLPVDYPPADATPIGNGTPIIDITTNIGTPTTNPNPTTNLFDSPFTWSFPIDGFRIGGFRWQGFGFFEPRVTGRHNFDRPTDVNQDLQTTAVDALIIINALNDQGTRQQHLTDTNNDGVVTAADALIVINQLHNTIGHLSGDAEHHDEGIDERNADDTLDPVPDNSLLDPELDDKLDDHELDENDVDKSEVDDYELGSNHHGERIGRFGVGHHADDFFARFDDNDDGLFEADEVPTQLWDHVLAKGVDEPNSPADNYAGRRWRSSRLRVT